MGFELRPTAYYSWARNPEGLRKPNLIDPDLGSRFLTPAPGPPSQRFLRIGSSLREAEIEGRRCLSVEAKVTSAVFFFLIKTNPAT